MLEGLQAVGAAWRAIVHVSEWSGLSVGALAGCGALFYFVPLARKIAIIAAFDVLIAWACLVHGHSVGVADEDARLQTISNQNDARAAAAANADETALVSAIQAKAKEQHDADLAEIARLKASGAPSCAFDPDGGDVGSVRAQSRQAGSGAVDGNAKPAAGAPAPDKSAGSAASGRRLPFPLVPSSWLPGKGHNGHAAADGQ